MIIDEKFILAAPPPPYVSPQTSIVLGSNNPYNPYRQHFNVSLPALPSHLLLQVVYSTFPQAVCTSDGELFASQRENLYWLETSLRLVNRALYIGVWTTFCCKLISYINSLHAYPALDVSSDL